MTWDDNPSKGYINISMPNYVHKKLIKYGNIPSTRLQSCPIEPNPIKYGKDSDKIKPEKESSKSCEQDENSSKKM